MGPRASTWRQAIGPAVFELKTSGPTSGVSRSDDLRRAYDAHRREIEPMTLGAMRKHGIKAVDAACGRRDLLGCSRVAHPKLGTRLVMPPDGCP